jgi:hypothetical protein
MPQPICQDQLKARISVCLAGGTFSTGPARVRRGVPTRCARGIRDDFDAANRLYEEGKYADAAAPMASFARAIQVPRRFGSTSGMPI